MKRLAIILGLLMFAPAAFAGGTVLFMDGGGYVYPQQQQQQQIQYDPTSTYYTTSGVYGNGLTSDQSTKKRVSKTTKRVRVGNQKNDPNVYWNFGAVNFGSGFTTVGGGDKKF